MINNERTGFHPRSPAARNPKRTKLRKVFAVHSMAGLALLGFLEPGFAQDIVWDHIGVAPREARPAGSDVIGDIDGDGVQEVITGMATRALATIRSGATGAILKEHHLLVHSGANTGFGGSVAGLGDFDGDQVPDYAVGAPTFSDPSIGISTGIVFVYSGSTHKVIARITGLIQGEGAGFQIVGLGDVNGDGYSDVGISPYSGSMFRIHLGPDGALLRQTAGGSGVPENKGSFGDHDGDGCADYLVGNRLDSTLANNAGGVKLYSGKTGALLLTMHADRPDQLAGHSVSRGGDWNGDGIEDIIAGAPGLTQLQSSNFPTGVYVFSGADGSILHYFDGEAYCQQKSAFGYSVSSGKDVNGDGIPDLIVGAPLEPYNNVPGVGLRGSSFLFSGETGQLLWERTGTVAGERSGTRVKLIEDHNFDGLADWMVMGPQHDDGTWQFPYEHGRVTIFAGAVGDAVPHCDGGTNSLGLMATLLGAGPISLRENQFALQLTYMPQATTALIVHQRSLAPATPFGPGQLCLKAPLGILAVVTTSLETSPTDPGQATLGLDLESPPFKSTTSSLHPGDSWAFQVLYRDQNQRNTSNALEVVFVP